MRKGRWRVRVFKGDSLELVCNGNVPLAMWIRNAGDLPAFPPVGYLWTNHLKVIQISSVIHENVYYDF